MRRSFSLTRIAEALRDFFTFTTPARIHETARLSDEAIDLIANRVAMNQARVLPGIDFDPVRVYNNAHKDAFRLDALHHPTGGQSSDVTWNAHRAACKAVADAAVRVHELDLQIIAQQHAREDAEYANRTFTPTGRKIGGAQ